MVRWVMVCAGCAGAGGSSTDPLDASFGERLTEGYHCGLTWYLTHDDDRSIRLQAGLTPNPNYGGPETSDLDEFDATLGVSDDAALQVYVGECLMTPGCTDDIGETPGCRREQEIVHAYDAVAGEAHLDRSTDGTISGTVLDLVLRGRGSEPDVEVAELPLLAVPEWVE